MSELLVFARKQNLNVQVCCVAFVTIACSGRVVAAEVKDPAARVAAAMAFAEQLLDRELEAELQAERYAGREAFESRRRIGTPVGGGVQREWAILRGDRQVVRHIVYGPESEGWRSKTMSSPERTCAIGYTGRGEDEGIETFSEGPANHRFISPGIGGGVWFGYLFGTGQPEFSHWSPLVDWTASNDGSEIRATYEDDECVFVFPDATAERPARIELRALKPVAWSGGPPYKPARTIKFLEWDVIDGIECPKRFVLWGNTCLFKRGWLSLRYEWTLESVGPVQEPISDRYGDFFTDVPDGTRLQVDDYLGIDFIWEDGEIVRKIDRVKLESLLDQPFFGSPLPRYILIGAGVCALAAAGWFVWRGAGRTASASHR